MTCIRIQIWILWTYVELDELLAKSDLISLHCPLMENTHHMINIDTINKMKDGVILVNTSRGGLVKTDDLITGIRERKFFGVGLGCIRGGDTERI